MQSHKSYHVNAFIGVANEFILLLLLLSKTWGIWQGIQHRHKIYSDIGPEEYKEERIHITKLKK